MKVFIALLLACLVSQNLCALERKLSVIPKSLCAPAIAGADAIVKALLDCAAKQTTGFTLPEDKKEALTDKITGAILPKLGCPTKRRLFSMSGAATSMMKKAGSIVKDVACKAVEKTCSPACASGVTAVATFVTAYGIPAACVSGPVTDACTKVCKGSCKR